MKEQKKNKYSIPELRNRIFELEKKYSELENENKYLKDKNNKQQKSIQFRDKQIRKNRKKIAQYDSFCKFFEYLPLFFYVFDDEKQKIEQFNFSIFENLGYTETEDFNQFFCNILTDDTRQDFLEQGKVLKINSKQKKLKENSSSVLFKIKDNNNHNHWLHSELVPIELDANGTKVTKILGAAIDMTSRIRGKRRIESILRDFINETDLSKVEQLTRRQKEIFILLAKQKNTQEIADTLFISTNTVNKHKQTVKNALKLPSVQAVVSFGQKLGFHLDD